mmetsp:Transcript_25403/g.60510  ORF Transcript_25403/g.60510 Transcript_25403/m.60510 type:complete len:743 (-) Transcript_25403:949-3177(-)
MCDGNSSCLVDGIRRQQVGAQHVVLLKLLEAIIPGIRLVVCRLLLAGAAVLHREDHRRQEGLQQQAVAPNDDVVGDKHHEDAEDQPTALSGHVHHPGVVVPPLQLLLRLERCRTVCRRHLVVVFLRHEQDLGDPKQATPVAGHQSSVAKGPAGYDRVQKARQRQENHAHLQDGLVVGRRLAGAMEQAPLVQPEGHDAIQKAHAVQRRHAARVHADHEDHRQSLGHPQGQVPGRQRVDLLQPRLHMFASLEAARQAGLHDEGHDQGRHRRAEDLHEDGDANARAHGHVPGHRELVELAAADIHHPEEGQSRGQVQGRVHQQHQDPGVHHLSQEELPKLAQRHLRHGAVPLERHQVLVDEEEDLIDDQHHASGTQQFHDDHGVVHDPVLTDLLLLGVVGREGERGAHAEHLLLAEAVDDGIQKPLLRAFGKALPACFRHIQLDGGVAGHVCGHLVVERLPACARCRELLVGVEGRAVLFHRPAAPLRHRRGRGGATEDLNLADRGVVWECRLPALHLLLGLELEAEPVRRPRHGRPAGRLVVGGRGAGGAPLLGAAGVHLPVVVELVEDLGSRPVIGGVCTAGAQPVVEELQVAEGQAGARAGRGLHHPDQGLARAGQRRLGQGLEEHQRRRANDEQDDGQQHHKKNADRPLPHGKIQVLPVEVAGLAGVPHQERAPRKAQLLPLATAEKGERGEAVVVQHLRLVARLPERHECPDHSALVVALLRLCLDGMLDFLHLLILLHS